MRTLLLFLVFSQTLWAQKDVGFLDVTATAGLAVGADTTSLVFGDYNRDGQVDMIASSRLYKNISKENIKFQDVTAEVGLSRLNGNPVFVDINNDSRLDILTTGGQIYIQNIHGQFDEHSKNFGVKLPEKINAISFVDLNRDGFVDFFYAQAETHNAGATEFYHLPVKVYRNIAGQGFLDISNEFNFVANPSYTRSMVWSDYDQDGKPDGFFANYRLKPSFFLKNSADRFLDIGAKNGTAGPYDPNKFFDRHYSRYFGPHYGHAIGALWADLDNDGYFDLWVSKLAHKAAYYGDVRGYYCDDSKIFKNSGAPEFKFTDMREPSGIPILPLVRSGTVYEELWAHSTSADYDNDGFVDVYVTQVYNLAYAYSHLFRNAGNFKFSDQSQALKVFTHDTYAAGWADLNSDGRMDLIVGGIIQGTTKRHIRVFENTSENGHHYLKIRLEGNASGKNPVTASVKLTTAQGIQVRQYEGTVGTMSQQNDPTLHFGLGQQTEVQKIEVIWPSGQSQEIVNPQIDTTLIIEEPTWNYLENE